MNERAPRRVVPAPGRLRLRMGRMVGRAEAHGQSYDASEAVTGIEASGTIRRPGAFDRVLDAVRQRTSD
jgi:hypothetical protein